MIYRTIPNTDLNLSAIGFGCWSIGGQYWGDDTTDAEGQAAVRAAMDLGVNWFDTAPLYGRDHHSDRLLARALGSKKHDVTIATKVGPRWDSGTGHAISDLTPSNIRRDVESSLRRLGLDRIALLQVHWPCNLDTPLEQSLDTLMALRAEGKVQHLGLCNYDAAGLMQAQAIADIATLQTPYSMVRREFEHSLRPAVWNAEGPDPTIGVLAYETLCRGLLTGKYGPEPPEFPDSDMRSHDDRFRGRAFAQINQLNRALAVIARKTRTPQAAIPIAWALTRPGVTHAIVGAKRPEQFAEACQAIRLVDRDQIWAALESYVDAVRP